VGAYQVAVAGSGNGDLVDGFVYKFELDVARWPENLSEHVAYGNLCALVNDYHDNEVALYPSDSASEKLNDFLVCIKPKGSPDIFLWEIRGTAVTPMSNHTLMGIGASIYKHELSRLYRPLLSANQSVLLGVHLFSLAKATSNYVGGPIEIIFVGESGMTVHASKDVLEMEEKVAQFNSKIADLILACPDIALSEFFLDQMLVDFQKAVKDMRRQWTHGLFISWSDRLKAGNDQDPYPIMARGSRDVIDGKVAKYKETDTGFEVSLSSSASSSVSASPEYEGEDDE
jgi:hypothetical protein